MTNDMDETMELAANSSGDGKRFQQEIKALSEQMVVIREQLEMAKEQYLSFFRMRRKWIINYSKGSSQNWSTDL